MNPRILNFVALVPLILAFVLTRPLNAEPKRIAVLELHDYADLSRPEVEYVTDIVRKQALELPQDEYFVMTRENIQEHMPPDVTLADCEGECEIEAGRRVGADFVLSGEVLRFGAKFKVSLKLHETKNGRLLAQDNAEADTIGGLEAMVATAASRVYGNLPGQKKASTIGSSVTITEYGGHSCDSDPKRRRERVANARGR